MYLLVALVYLLSVPPELQHFYKKGYITPPEITSFVKKVSKTNDLTLKYMIADALATAYHDNLMLEQFKGCISRNHKTFPIGERLKLREKISKRHKAIANIFNNYIPNYLKTAKYNDLKYLWERIGNEPIGNIPIALFDYNDVNYLIPGLENPDDEVKTYISWILVGIYISRTTPAYIKREILSLAKKHPILLRNLRIISYFLDGEAVELFRTPYPELNIISLILTTRLHHYPKTVYRLVKKLLPLETQTSDMLNIGTFYYTQQTSKTFSKQYKLKILDPYTFRYISYNKFKVFAKKTVPTIGINQAYKYLVNAMANPNREIRYQALMLITQNYHKLSNENKSHFKNIISKNPAIKKYLKLINFRFN